MQLDQARRELLRWQILHILNYCREACTNEQQILLVLGDEIADCTLWELRQEISYLGSKELIDIERKDTSVGKVLCAKISAAGIDFVEHNSLNVVGISRPAKYWN